MTAEGAPPQRRGILDAELLATCISCGFCLPACPTYRLTGDERSSPRGRITLMRALEEGRLEPDDPTLAHEAGFCLGCRACESVCPAGVRYGALLEQWRDHQWRDGRGPLPAVAARTAMGWTPLVAAAGRLRGAAPTTRTPASGPGDGLHLMLGCAERVLFPGVSRAVRELLPDVVDVPAGQGCCGAVHGHNGASREGHERARELGALLPGRILTTAGGCAAHLAETLGRDRVVELSTFLVEHWGENPPLRRLTTADVPGLTRPAGPTGRPDPNGPTRPRTLRLGLQDSCHLRNALDGAAPPRALLARVGDYVELPSAGTCCGSAGTYALARPADSRRVLQPHLDEVAEADLDVLVVVNPVCQQQLTRGLRRAGSRTRVLHLAELLALAVRPADQPDG